MNKFSKLDGPTLRELLWVLVTQREQTECFDVVSHNNGTCLCKRSAAVIDSVKEALRNK